MPESVSKVKRLYTRALPSGGYVAIEAQPVRTLFGSQKLRGLLIVERRPESRREGHRAPIAATAEHARFRDIIDALFPIAHSDQALEQLLSRRVTAAAFAGKKLRIT